MIDVNAPRTSPLASGIYTVKIESGSLTAAETTFGVAGDPAAIAFETADPGAIGTQFESIITVTDAAGEPVADGTPVAVSLRSRGPRISDPVSRVSPAVQRTVNGRVTARFVVIGCEVATIQAEAAGVSRLDVVDARTAPASEETGPADSLASSEPDSFTSWAGAGAAAATASSLLADSPGLDRVFVWNGLRWVLYAEADGVPIPGSLDFTIEPGDVLWLGSFN